MPSMRAIARESVRSAMPDAETGPLGRTLSIAFSAAGPPLLLEPRDEIGLAL